MKKSIQAFLAVITLVSIVTIQTANAQATMEPWPGVTVKVLTDNEHVKILEITFAPGAVTDWHSHPQHTLYALTDVNMKEELKGQEATTAQIKAGQAMWSPAVTHKTTNVGKNLLRSLRPK